MKTVEIINLWRYLSISSKYQSDWHIDQIDNNEKTLDKQIVNSWKLLSTFQIDKPIKPHFSNPPSDWWSWASALVFANSWSDVPGAVGQRGISDRGWRKIWQSEKRCGEAKTILKNQMMQIEKQNISNGDDWWCSRYYQMAMCPASVTILQSWMGSVGMAIQPCEWKDDHPPWIGKWANHPRHQRLDLVLSTIHLGCI